MIRCSQSSIIVRFVTESWVCLLDDCFLFLEWGVFCSLNAGSLVCEALSFGYLADTSILSCHRGIKEDW